MDITEFGNKQGSVSGNKKSSSVTFLIDRIMLSANIWSISGKLLTQVIDFVLIDAVDASESDISVSDFIIFTVLTL